MPTMREQSLSSLVYAAGTVKEVDLPIEGWVKGLHCHLEGTLSLSGGVASGTVINLPLSPLGAIKNFWIDIQPGMRVASKLQIPTQLLYLMGYRLQYRQPTQTPLDNGGAGSHAFSIDFLVPFSLWNGDNAYNSLLKCRGERQTFKASVEWQASDTAVRDALLSGCDRTASVTSMKLDIVAADTLEAPGPQVHEVGLRYQRIALVGAGDNEILTTLQRGEFLRAIAYIAVDTGARSDAILDRVRLKRDGIVIRELKHARVQSKNQEDYALPDGKIITGGGIVDFDLAGDLANVVEVGENRPLLNMNTGSTAPTAPSYVEVLYEVVALSPEGVEFAKEKGL